jgi:hypothetical protein
MTTESIEKMRYIIGEEDLEILTDEEYFKKYGIDREEAKSIINEINKPAFWDYINR